MRFRKWQAKLDTSQGEDSSTNHQHALRASFVRRTEPDLDRPDVACVAANFRLDILLDQFCC